MTRGGTTADAERESVALGSDLGFALGSVFRSYAKTGSLVLDEVPGGHTPATEALRELAGSSSGTPEPGH